MKSKTILLILVTVMTTVITKAQTDAEKANANYKLAEEEFEKGQYQNTVDYLTSAIKLNPLFETKASYLMAKSFDKLSLSSSDASKSALLKTNCLNSINYYIANGKDENKKTELTQIKIKMESGKSTSDKPSKEETIKWITDKVNAYGNVIDVFFKVPYITTLIDGKLTCKMNGGSTYSTEIVNIFDISSIEDDYRPRFVHLLTNGQRVQYSGNTYDKNSKEFFILQLNWDAEPNLKDRMIKAINNLIEYNKENQTKETY